VGVKGLGQHRVMCAVLCMIDFSGSLNSLSPDVGRAEAEGERVQGFEAEG